MDVSKMQKEISEQKNESQELGKIKELSKKIEQDDSVKTPKLTREEGDDLLEKRLEDGNEKTDADKLNKKGEVSFGTAGCEGFCQKVHDGTKVHGTY